MTWQYNGVAPWADIVEWCNTTIPDHCWSNGYETITFDNSGAYALFLLKWGNR